MMVASSLLYLIIDCAIMIYQYCISPLILPSCRFTPSCSHYARSALKIHGPFKGLWLATARIMKCHPWHDGGHDPVPTVKQRNTQP
ncbi:MAG: membrane protein insertion efficiency factor YidD [Proteobacteria bacterium]|nr:membrane protein insertion efficiency factor YidD [Pseudomonadota bacterium]